MKLPIFGNNGREVIGYAEGVRSATVAIRRAITVPSGFKLLVWQRSKAWCDMSDLLELPDGFVYSIYR